ncbi:MAG: hypothetical protein ACYCQJ_12185 [Nitrososphaerales archaeon]
MSLYNATLDHRLNYLEDSPPSLEDLKLVMYEYEWLETDVIYVNCSDGPFVYREGGWEETCGACVD